MTTSQSQLIKSTETVAISGILHIDILGFFLLPIVNTLMNISKSNVFSDYKQNLCMYKQDVDI